MRKDNYNCFSYKVKQYLYKNNVMEIHTQVHSKTGRTFWVYVRDEKLDELLSNWTNKTNL